MPVLHVPGFAPKVEEFTKRFRDGALNEPSPERRTQASVFTLTIQGQPCSYGISHRIWDLDYVWVTSSSLRGECFHKGDPSKLAQEALLGVASEDMLISPQDQGHCWKSEILDFSRHQRWTARGKKTAKDGEGGREMADTGATLRSSWGSGEDWVPF